MYYLKVQQSQVQQITQSKYFSPEALINMRAIWRRCQWGSWDRLWEREQWDIISDP